MTLPEEGGLHPRCRWDCREDFLLLPGDGLILVSGDGLISHFDHKALRLMGSTGPINRGDALEAIWPDLAMALEHHAIDVCDTGPVDVRLRCGKRQRTVRLFRSDNGVGIAVLSDRTGGPDPVSQQLLMHQRILRYVRDAVIVTTSEPIDAPGPVIVHANPAALRQTGYRLEEVLGRSPRMFQGADTDPQAIATFHEALRHWQPVRQSVLNYRKDGSSFWVEIDIAPLEDADGWYTYWVSVQRESRGPRRPT